MRSSLFFLYRSSSAPEMSNILQRARESCQLTSEGQTGRNSCCQFHNTDQCRYFMICSYRRHVLSSRNTLLSVLMQLIVQVSKVGQHEAMQCQADKPCKTVWVFSTSFYLFRCKMVSGSLPMISAGGGLTGTAGKGLSTAPTRLK